jgi:hypothetical protein
VTGVQTCALPIYNILNYSSPYIFLDIIERYFLWNKNNEIKTKWSGVIHCTPITPDYLQKCNLSLLFTNNSFINSLDYCYCIFTLSKYITKYLEEEFLKINKKVKVFTLKHPIDTNNIKLFDINMYINNTSKKIVQVGQQLRKCSSIYLLNIENHTKIWLTGTRNIKACDKLLKKEFLYLSINTKSIKDDVNMYYTNTIEEYDDILSKNIIFVDLFDASANNVVLECIIRNTPIIINKLEAIVEYLGNDYPLYFTNLDEINDLLNINNLRNAHEYLKNMDKTDITMNYFIKEIINHLASLNIN